MKTLFIGLGGWGGKVVAETKKQIEAGGTELGSCHYLALDRDIDELVLLGDQANIPWLHMSLVGPYQFYIRHHHRPEEIALWFPMLPEYLEKAAGYAAGRFIGRLTFLEAMESALTRTLQYLLYTLHTDPAEKLRVVIVTALSGTTGSGAFIQLALLLRKLDREFSSSRIEICGFFAGPELFIQATDENQRPVDLCEKLRGNAHAALRELSWLNGLHRGTVFSSNPFELDGLFRWPEVSVQNDVFDYTYIYDASQNSGKTPLPLQEHIKCMAKYLQLRYASTATESIDKVFRRSPRLWREQATCFSLDENYVKSAHLIGLAKLGMRLSECEIATSEKCRAAYQFACSQHETESVPGPHLDKRWPRWLAGHW